MLFWIFSLIVKPMLFFWLVFVRPYHTEKTSTITIMLHFISLCVLLKLTSLNGSLRFLWRDVTRGFWWHGDIKSLLVLCSYEHRAILSFPALHLRGRRNTSKEQPGPNPRGSSVVWGMWWPCCCCCFIWTSWYTPCLYLTPSTQTVNYDWEGQLL